MANLTLEDAKLQWAYIHVPLASFCDADGDIAQFANGGANGLTLADSEAVCLRFNNDATPVLLQTQVSLPPDLDDTEPMQFQFLCSKSGATVGDATTLTIAAYILASGDLHDSDANCGGATNAVTGVAAAKTTTTLIRNIAAADIPSGAQSMTFSVKPTDGTLGTDDFMIHSVRIRYSRKAHPALTT